MSEMRITEMTPEVKERIRQASYKIVEALRGLTFDESLFALYTVTESVQKHYEVSVEKVFTIHDGEFGNT